MWRRDVLCLLLRLVCDGCCDAHRLAAFTLKNHFYLGVYYKKVYLCVHLKILYKSMNTFIPNKKQRNRFLTFSAVLFFLYSCFKDRPHIDKVQVNQQTVHYATPYHLDKTQETLDLHFMLSAKKQLKYYSLTITDGQTTYHPNLKNIREADGFRGRKTEFLDGVVQEIHLQYTQLQLEKGKYEAEIIVSDWHGYQTKSTFILLVE